MSMRRALPCPRRAWSATSSCAGGSRSSSSDRTMRLAVLVSGTGTNLASLLEAQAAGTLAPAQVVLVLSNRPGVAALEVAARAGVTTAVVDHTRYAERADFDRAVLGQLR